MITKMRNFLYGICPRPFRPYWDKVDLSPIGSRLARGIFWAMAGSVISRGLMLCATILVARILGNTVYGELGMIQSTIGMFGVFAGFGLGVTATKHVAEFRQTDPERAGRIIGLSGLFAMLTGGLMALGLFSFAPWLAEHTINAPHLTNVLRVGALILFINALNGAQTGTLSGFEAFRVIARVNLLVGLISFPFLVCGAYLGGLDGAVWALVINLCFNWLLNYIALRKEAQKNHVPFSLKGFGKEWTILWRFSLPAAFSGALVGPVIWACSALLVNQPYGYAEMGIYSAANQWCIAILFIPGILGQVLLPILSSLSRNSKGRHYQKILVSNIFLNFGITLAAILPLVLLAPYIMSAYGPEFEKGASVLRVLSFSAVLVAANNVVGQSIISMGKMWTGFLFNALWAAALLIVASIMLNKGYGALGLAYATLIAYTLHTAWQGIYLKMILRCSDNPQL